MPKLKSNKGLLKRVRITKSGRVKFSRAFHRHLQSHKSGKRKRQLRNPAYATSGDIRRIQACVPSVRLRGKALPKPQDATTPAGEASQD